MSICEKILPKFTENVEILFDECLEMVEEAKSNNLTTLSPTIINIFKPLLSSFDTENMMQQFVEHSYSHWQEIKNRNIAYFKEIGLEMFMEADRNGSLDNSKHCLVSKFGNSNLKLFKEILEIDSIFTVERQHRILDIIIGCICLSVKYIHHKREPKDKKYTNDYLKIVNMKESVKLFNVKL